jgi:sugar-specific transcriptional regulator TrmB
MAYYSCMNNLIEIIKNLGLSEKASKLYLASIELGEASVQELSKTSGLKRTTIYYTLDELKKAGAIVETERNKKTYFIPESPRNVLKRVKERLWDFEQSLEEIESKKHAVFNKPRLYFLYGSMGFKQIWDMIFAQKDKEFRIITEAGHFTDFVREKYILDEIIKTKKKLGISSKQLIQDSELARQIVAKDKQENRQSKIISSRYKIPFTEVICQNFVAFISPRWDDTLFVVENEAFAQTRRSVFDVTWDNLK